MIFALEREPFRIVIAGRTIPNVGLEQLCRRGDLFTIGPDDLCLSERETADLVRAISMAQVDD